ncbi:ankyrin repeat-containing domain protein [Hypoxylon crocopeplum]|nr:ankyrin repeat-containing domain protein [Hypoxylon crocopeplum]
MDRDKTTALLEAATTGRLDVLEKLLAAEKCPAEETIQSLLTTATWNCHVPVVSFLLSEYPYISLNEETIRAAVYSGSVDLFATLISKDPTIINRQFDRRGTPLAVACQSQQPANFLEFLLKEGADPNQDPDVAPFPLASVAAFYGDTNAAALLLEYGARLEHTGALAAAAGRGNEVMVRYLLEHGAEQDTDVVENREPELALHVAARKGRLGVVRILLEYGTDLGKRDAQGRTALEIVRELEKKGGSDLSEVKTS